MEKLHIFRKINNIIKVNDISSIKVLKEVKILWNKIKYQEKPLFPSAVD